MANLHPDLAPVAALIGTWSGSGFGEYPTIETFRYAEAVTFSHVGKPFLSYTQRTRSLGDDHRPGAPMHAESGYWRFPSPGRVEVVLAHPTGVTEVQEGTIELGLDGSIVIDLRTVDIGLTATAKSVSALARTFRLRDDELSYDVRMAAVGIPLQHHLAATLHRDE
jgi:hypothetical protein